MRLQFIGSGDAFGSGGRFNTCFHLTGARTNALIDCGASSVVALKKSGIDRNAIDTILITHVHADHFGGIPFFILDAQLAAKRAEPLLIAGPPGLPGWYDRLLAATFPGERTLPYPLTLREVDIGKPNTLGGLRVTPFAVKHADNAGPCLAYRIEVGDKVLCYSGDTEWTDALLEAAQGADLFVCEAYTFDRKLTYHLDYQTLLAHRQDLGCRRLVVTHLSDDMLGRLAALDIEAAADGKVITL